VHCSSCRAWPGGPGSSRLREQLRGRACPLALQASCTQSCRPPSCRLREKASRVSLEARREARELQKPEKEEPEEPEEEEGLSASVLLRARAKEVLLSSNLSRERPQRAARGASSRESPVSGTDQQAASMMGVD
jgi:hypothetical protein